MAHWRLEKALNLIRGKPAPAPLPTGFTEVHRTGLNLRVDMDTYLGRTIYQTGAFEPLTLQWMDRLLKPGMNVLDVGANIGYFTAYMAKRVAPGGHVWAFEPTEHYGRQARWHIEHNGLAEATSLIPLALSDTSETLEITIGDSSATMHPLAESHRHATEQITTRRLDDVAAEIGLPPIDFVKVDIDGHESRFLKGAHDFFQEHRPNLLIEFFQANLDVAGSDVRELREQLEAMGYQLLSEKTGEPFASRWDFLQECGNFTHSVNVLARPREAAQRRQAA